MDKTLLNGKLKALSRFSAVPAKAAEHFGKLIASLEQWELFRINPLHFAEAHDLDKQETLCLFLHAVKVGLFDFDWNTICPVCGRVEHSYESINLIRPEGFHCTLCRIDVPAELDDYIEVNFTINPALKTLDLDPYQSPAHFRRWFFTPSLELSAQLSDYINASTHAIRPLKANDTTQFDIQTESGKPYQVVSLTLHHMLWIEVQDEASPPLDSIAEVTVLPTGFMPDKLLIPPGSWTIHLRNLCEQEIDLLLLQKNYTKAYELVARHPPIMHPLLSAKKLLNNHHFRNLFRTQHLKNDLRLNIRSLTLLFTDLKGSTELYDRMGDAFAYNLIQSHFRILEEAVQKNAGAIVKTMGDAVMASFSRPQDGMQAGLDMNKGLLELNRNLSNHSHRLGLKIGLHEGMVLAVNADQRLDYFGQTVNIAARVQALADSGEIWLTQPVWKARGIAAQATECAYAAEEHTVKLKGVSDAATVYRLSRGMDEV